MEPAKRPNKDQQAEISRVVRRLEAIVTNQLEGARRVGHPLLTLEQVIAIIDALCAETEGQCRPVAFPTARWRFT